VGNEALTWPLLVGAPTSPFHTTSHTGEHHVTGLCLLKLALFFFVIYRRVARNQPGQAFSLAMGMNLSIICRESRVLYITALGQ
jgi:hypothetical protein